MPVAHLPSSSPLSPSLSSQLFTMSCQPTARLTTAPAYSVCVQRLSRSFSESLEHIPLSPQPVVQPTQSRLSSLYVVYRHSAESPIQKMCKKFVTHQVALFPPLLNVSASLTLVMYITLYLNVLHSGSWWLSHDYGAGSSSSEASFCFPFLAFFHSFHPFSISYLSFFLSSYYHSTPYHTIIIPSYPNPLLSIIPATYFFPCFICPSQLDWERQVFPRLKRSTGCN